MKSLALIFLLLAALTQPCLAARWQALGNADNSLDKVYIDTDSVEQVDSFRIVRLMTVYPAPRTNKNNITMNSVIQLTAFDCEKKTGHLIQEVGYLNTKQSGSGPVATDWKTKMVAVANNPITLRALSAACSLPFATGKKATVDAPSAQAQPQPKFLTGSGIIVNDEGYILTNAHVVKSCKTISAKPLNVDTLSAKLEAIDPKNDLALIKTTAGYGQPAQFRPESKPAKLGETVGVVGYPLTGFLSAEPKATFGQINSVAGAGNDYTLLQISAPIQAGNSGSPVFDASGNVIAIVVSQAASLAQLLKTGTVPQNVNFAIRGELAQIFMQAHGVRFKVGDRKKELRTDEIADAGQKSTALLICTYE
ncbi:MAG: serine protease [Terracidiphilus sp.]|jgi:S1-C subfamily serine protease